VAFSGGLELSRIGHYLSASFKQHQAMVEAGKSKSERESARIISGDLPESEMAIRHRIRQGKKEVVRVGPKESNEQNQSQNQPVIDGQQPINEKIN
jgi:hypothetical protein